MRTANGESAPVRVEFGAAQGSVLGPLFFIIVMNDLQSFITNNFAVAYADDVTTITRSKNLADAEVRAARVTNLVEFWFACNRFSVNKNKCHRLLLTLRHIPMPFDAGTVRMLGVDIDGRLTWRVHGNALAARLCQFAYLLKRLSFAVAPGLLKSVYYATFHSAMSYCILV